MDLEEAWLAEVKMERKGLSDWPSDDDTQIGNFLPCCNTLQMNPGGGGALYPEPPDFDGEQRYDRLDDSRYCKFLP